MNSSQGTPQENDRPQTTADRRDFIKATAGALGGALTMGFPAIISAQTVTKAIKVGLVGCGGRGTGAASQALHADDYAELTAVAEVYQPQIDQSLATLGRIPKIASRVKVDQPHQYVGLDAYQKVISSDVDVVLLATPPGFRPIHLTACVDANKHIFCEKPAATHPAGIRMAMAAVEKSKTKNISLVAGFCWRYNDMVIDTFKQVSDGAIGKLVAYHATYYTNPVKPMPPESTRPPGMSDAAWQVKNWYNFVWLCGDSVVEQAVHSVDKIAWIMKDEPPVSCVAVGGRVIPAEGGNIYDHFDVNYLYPNGTRAFLANRQIEGCYNENADYLLGSEGTCTLGRSPMPRIEGKTNWTWTGQKYDMYQREHDVLFASIRKQQPVNDGKRLVTSTLLAIMGRMAAYTGQEVTWDQAMNSQENLYPENLTWDSKLTVAPRAEPGITKLV
ncbi:MAG TPA: Gfo/Idh/MocA family oxidoreductase [Bryobacteraceae bacterium]|jgi:predicted dehydrogenase|nr:Gfo/Idh/MocA family oxidoreductase [Bryobacteraceae bacterium]